MHKHLLELMRTSAWAMEPHYLDRCLMVFNSYLEGEALTDEKRQAIAAAKRARSLPEGENGAYQDGSVAVIPVTGIIARHASQVQGISGPTGTSVETIQQQLDAALADPSVEAVMLRVDSPGGSATGIAELAESIRAATKEKPVHAHGDGLVASAAYWIASSAERVTATKSTEVGSIGVYTTLADTTGYWKKKGVDVHLVKAGKHKAIGASGVPVTKEDRAVVQEGVDAIYAMFTDDVAAGRFLEGDRVLELADGRVHLAAAAAGMGLLDSVESFEGALAALQDAQDTDARQEGGQRGRFAALVGCPDEPGREEEAAVAAEADHGQESEMGSKTAETVVAAVKGADSPTQEAIDEMVAKAGAEACAAERARVLGILAACGDAAEPLPMAVELIETGATKTEALEQVNAELKSRMEAEAAAPAKDADAPMAAGNKGSDEAKPLTIEQRVEQEWGAMAADERATWANDQEVFSLERTAELEAAQA